jgi:hypothetical protein
LENKYSYSTHTTSYIREKANSQSIENGREGQVRTAITTVKAFTFRIRRLFSGASFSGGARRRAEKLCFSGQLIIQVLRLRRVSPRKPRRGGAASGKAAIDLARRGHRNPDHGLGVSSWLPKKELPPRPDLFHFFSRVTQPKPFIALRLAGNLCHSQRTRRPWNKFPAKSITYNSYDRSTCEKSASGVSLFSGEEDHSDFKDQQYHLNALSGTSMLTHPSAATDTNPQGRNETNDTHDPNGANDLPYL